MQTYEIVEHVRRYAKGLGCTRRLKGVAAWRTERFSKTRNNGRMVQFISYHNEPLPVICILQSVNGREKKLYLEYGKEE